jgi:hypothetical protein
MPFAPSGYQFYRNVKDFGAKGDGVTDDTAAINRAAASFSSSNLGTLRCGASCGSTTTLGAVVYFPSGTYLISTPIIQYYYTQFIGNPTTKPTIKSTFNFTGVAMFDSDFYIPGGNGAEVSFPTTTSRFSKNFQSLKLPTYLDTFQSIVHSSLPQSQSLVLCYAVVFSTGIQKS